MKKVIDILSRRSDIADWKINIHRRESSEMFFIKGELDCVRRTDTTNNRVTVYVDHDSFRGDAQFYVYPSTGETELEKLCDEAVSRARLIKNAPYTLPSAEEGNYALESNFAEYEPMALAKEIAAQCFEANKVDKAAINSLEVFITRHSEEIVASSGLRKRQSRYEAMVEAIPTYNGERESVELYEQYNFSSYDPETLKAEIAEKMAEVKARYEAASPSAPLSCPVILGKQELRQLFGELVWDLDYSNVYSRGNIHSKGDAVQGEGGGDRISVTLLGELPGSVRSSRFDADGLALGALPVIENGIVVNYHGSNRFGQYIGEKPSGVLPCLEAAPGTLPAEAFEKGPALEIISMSGLQVDFYSDYIGGEVRLAYYNDGEKCVPLTGISISGSLSEVLSEIRFSEDIALCGGYRGPAKALIGNMKIF